MCIAARVGAGSPDTESMSTNCLATHAAGLSRVEGFSVHFSSDSVDHHGSKTRAEVPSLGKLHGYSRLPLVCANSEQRPRIKSRNILRSCRDHRSFQRLLREPDQGIGKATPDSAAAAAPFCVGFLLREFMFGRWGPRVMYSGTRSANRYTYVRVFWDQLSNQTNLGLHRCQRKPRQGRLSGLR
jgi:hypothetical protein